MPENALEDARFDHVSETGELVFVSGAGKFAVKVDEALERAILEAKQIRTETQEERQQQAPSTLPISQIQSLIRAGANPTRVAERYSLSEALVRRFSAAVETEKQYAIEQFLAVPAPKESRVRTLSELIERTFAAAHVRLEDVRWKATRRGLEPWKITAEFDSAGHAARAEWSWNMQLSERNGTQAHRRARHADGRTHREAGRPEFSRIIEFAGRFRTFRTYRTDGVRLECSGTGCTTSHEYQDHR